MDRKLIICLFLFVGLAHGQLVQEIIANSNAGVIGPFNFTLFDQGTCTSGSAPTTTCLGTSTYPSLPSGASYSVTNTNTDLLVSNSVNYNWPTFTLTGGAWANSSSNSLRLAYGIGTGDNVIFNFPSSGIQNTVSSCTPFDTTLPQTTSFTGRIDTWTMGASASQFTNMQLENGGTELYTPTECGVTGTTNCTGGEFVPTGSMPTNTWQIWCESQTLGANGTSFDGVWNTPQSGGALVSGSLMTNTATATTGLTNIKQETQIGVNAGPTGGYYSYWGTQIFCGLISSQTACGFPVAPGLQLIAPTISPASETIGSNPTVTMTNISSVTDSYYYTTCTTAGCTPATPTIASTPYSGSFTATPPEAVSAIAVRAAPYNNPASAITTNQYIAPNAGFVATAKCTAAATANCSNTGLSIASGDIIVVGIEGGSGSETFTISDSNSDTPTCSSVVEEVTDGYYNQMCMMKAGATVTSITCAQSNAAKTAVCIAAWYTPGTLAGTVDKSTGADNQNVTNWSSGNTAALAGNSELVVEFWAAPFYGAYTSTSTSGATQRNITTATLLAAMGDRTAWSSSATAATGVWSTALYGVGMVMVIK
jgi:hypothetical protein